ncbi:MAG: ABC transporter substrate-binding protein [Ruminococcus sp.]
MGKFKKVLAAAAAVVIGIISVGCENGSNSSESSESSSGGELKTVRIGSPAADATQLCENAGLALNLGYFDEELEKVGYKAEYIGFGQGGTAVNEALSSNQLDLAFVGDIPPLIAKSNGLDIKAVASLNSQAELGIVVGNNSGISTVSELKGKKVVAAFGTVTYVYLINLLNSNGMSIDDVEVINDIANGATLVASGDADAVISTGAGIYQFQNAGIGKVLASSRDNTDISAQFFVYGNTGYINENPEAIKAIIKALIRSKDTANADPDAAYKALEVTDKPASVVEQIYPREIGFDMFDPYITKKAYEKLDKTSKILTDSKVITKEVKAEEIITTEYLDAVYKELGLEIPS